VRPSSSTIGSKQRSKSIWKMAPSLRIKAWKSLCKQSVASNMALDESMLCSSSYSSLLVLSTCVQTKLCKSPANAVCLSHPKRRHVGDMHEWTGCTTASPERKRPSRICSPSIDHRRCWFKCPASRALMATTRGDPSMASLTPYAARNCWPNSHVLFQSVSVVAALRDSCTTSHPISLDRPVSLTSRKKHLTPPHCPVSPNENHSKFDHGS